MWSGDPMVKRRPSASLYASTPHLFVYRPTSTSSSPSTSPCHAGQPSLMSTDVETEPSDSGYADSTRSGTGSGRSSTPEPIYYSALELADKKVKQQNAEAMVRLSRSFQAVNVDVDDDEDDDDDDQQHHHHHHHHQHQHHHHVAEDGADRSAAFRSQRLSDAEMLRVETFFRGHQTRVYVCSSMANLYVRAAKSLVGLNRFSSQPDVCLRTGVQLQAGGGADGLVSNWQLKFTGVPVVLLDLGGTKSRQQRRIQLIVAERDTGFTLWRDTIDNLSNYESPQPTFHTMRLSTDHRIIAGLSFDCPRSAQQLFDQVEMLTSDPANIRLSAPKTSPSRSIFKFWSSTSPSSMVGVGSAGGAPDRTRPPKKHGKLGVRKSEISQPCFFQHVTSIDPTDHRRFFSMQAYVPK